MFLHTKILRARMRPWNKLKVLRRNIFWKSFYVTVIKCQITVHASFSVGSNLFISWLYLPHKNHKVTICLINIKASSISMASGCPYYNSLGQDEAARGFKIKKKYIVKVHFQIIMQASSSSVDIYCSQHDTWAKGRLI